VQAGRREDGYVWWFAPEQQRWVLQPLVDVGLADDEIRALLHRLARATDRAPHTLVSDEPAPVRAAWTHTIDRMLTLVVTEDERFPGRLPAPRSENW
jgi:hypothetical protein